MQQISKIENALVLRTDFSNRATWDAICATLQKPVGIFCFRADVDLLDDVKHTTGE